MLKILSEMAEIKSWGRAVYSSNDLYTLNLFYGNILLIGRL